MVQYTLRHILTRLYLGNVRYVNTKACFVESLRKFFEVFNGPLDTKIRWKVLLVLLAKVD